MARYSIVNRIQLDPDMAPLLIEAKLGSIFNLSSWNKVSYPGTGSMDPTLVRSQSQHHTIDSDEVSALERASNSSMLFPDSFASLRSFLNR
jgi:hypothetical protein